ncbi:MAG: hypothetical protein BSOLF_1657 [Candidatus Carbobacillus altaicus]|uniref:Uncharacterized protein n=1 Tax=Candidatus Carbonibacillus altaicus TaxID=2163959 RepID=A0A2R6Y3U0_9BACL|nr:MAG: hypothetical protein BSOLF_1657 [Candidatus Carbobacillus altaicus]
MPSRRTAEIQMRQEPWSTKKSQVMYQIFKEHFIFLLKLKY